MPLIRVKDGQVMVDIPAGNVGTTKFKGTITFMQDGEPVPVSFESQIFGNCFA